MHGSPSRETGELCVLRVPISTIWFFCPPAIPALTRRAKKNSRLHAVVLKWSRTRKRYERQGLLVEEDGLERAETECLADAQLRQAKRMREAERRDILDKDYVKRYSEQIRRCYPHMPSGLEVKIAEHACLKYSGRVGRSEAAKRFDEDSITLAVLAHVRHTRTDYDELLMRGVDRHDARSLVRENIDRVLEQWQGDS